MLIGATGLCYGILYARGLPTPGLSEGLQDFSLTHLLTFATYLFRYLGLPLSRSPQLDTPAQVLGATLCIAGLFVVVRDAITTHHRTSLHRIAIQLILMSLIIAVLAVIGRSGLDQELRVPVRYAILLMPVHVGFLALLGPTQARWASTPRRTSIVLWGGVVAATVLVVLQVVSGIAAVRASDAISATLARYDAGIRDDAMKAIVYPDLSYADRIMDEVKRLRSERLQ